MSLGTRASYPWASACWHGGTGWIWRDPDDPPILSPCRLLVPGQSISPVPSGHRRVQSGVARIVLLIARAVMPPSLGRGGPAPCTPCKGTQQGRLALLCKLCAGHAVPMVPCPPSQGLGLPCLGLVPRPEMEALTPLPLFLELLVRQTQCPANSPMGSLAAPCHLLLGPPHPDHKLGFPNRVPWCPHPDKGTAPKPAVSWGAMGKA